MFLCVISVAGRAAFDQLQKPLFFVFFYCLQGHVVPSWKARWFVLFQDRLLYYKVVGGKQESSPKGRIFLDGCTITCPCLEYENRQVSPMLDSLLSSLTTVLTLK